MSAQKLPCSGVVLTRSRRGIAKTQSSKLPKLKSKLQAGIFANRRVRRTLTPECADICTRTASGSDPTRIGTQLASRRYERNGACDESRSAARLHDPRLRMRRRTLSRGGDESRSQVCRRKRPGLWQSRPPAEPHHRCRAGRRRRANRAGESGFRRRVAQDFGSCLAERYTLTKTALAEPPDSLCVTARPQGCCGSTSIRVPSH